MANKKNKSKAIAQRMEQIPVKGNHITAALGHLKELRADTEKQIKGFKPKAAERSERRVRTHSRAHTPMFYFRSAILKAGMEADRAHDVSAAEIACVFAELAAKWARVAVCDMGLMQGTGH